MELSYSPADEAFRRELRVWLRRNLPRRNEREEGLAYSDPRRIEVARAWQRKLYEAGYVAMGWPREYGGQGATVERQSVANEEMVRNRAPGLIGQMGVRMVGPTLIEHGTPAQRERFLPRILTAEDIWCQGYSEPGAGSDLASLRTRAELEGDSFLINGQKIWTSTAQFADWMFCLVRTDPEAPKHKGISYLLIDMRSPGIEVRPLVQMTGDAGFNEVFFTDVMVPRENLIGRLNEGWTVANSTLKHERNMLASTTQTQQLLADLLRLAGRRTRGGVKATRDPVLRQQLADLLIRVEAMKYHALKQLSDEIHGRSPGIGASINKLVTTELNHSICETALEVLGNFGPLTRSAPHVEDRGSWPKGFMFSLGMIIGGGTSQIQKNIIAERGLGLPRG